MTIDRRESSSHTGRVTRRLTLLVVAIPAVALAIAVALPMYTCKGVYEFEEWVGPGGGPTCAFTDMGYRPDSWLPTKITIGAAGIVTAIAVALWSRGRRALGIGLVIAFGLLASAWFALDA